MATLGNLSATYDGSPKSATATTTPAGLAVTITYNGSAIPPTTPGTIRSSPRSATLTITSVC
ncbi:MBG domain-containing protein [Geotalea uraniireducens]|uniref:MBG domain-containing protein n=1 Tax=Geotalea uraniireducens TaxID=351604 RepID=UPI00389946A9